MTALLDTAVGFCVIAALLLRTRGTNHPYWRWRDQTAEGDPGHTGPVPGSRLRAILHYFRWVGRMRRLS